MLPTLLGLGGSAAALNFSHVAVGLLMAGLGWWAKQTPKPVLADVVPAAHAGTIASLLEEIAADPTVLQLVQLVLSRFADQKTVAAHAALQAVAAPIAVPVAVAK